MPANIDECTAETKWKFYITKMNSYRKILQDSLYLGLICQKNAYCMIMINLFFQLHFTLYHILQHPVGKERSYMSFQNEQVLPSDIQAVVPPFLETRMQVFHGHR